MSERRFPIQCSRITSIPWAMIAPHEAQALRNHRQTLERLGARGGLSPREVLAVIGGRGLPRMYPENAERRLVVAVAQWEAEQPVQPAPSAPLIPQSRADAMVAEEREVCAGVLDELAQFHDGTGNAVASIQARKRAAALRARKAGAGHG